MSGAEIAALTAAMAPEAAAAGTAAAGTAAATALPAMAGGTAASMFGMPAATSAMTQSLLAPLGTASTPFFTEAAMATGMGSDSAALAKALSPETFSLGAPPNAASNGLDWTKMAKQGLDMMESGQQQRPQLGQRPDPYRQQKSMQEQFAEIMGWLQKNGGM